MCYTVYNPRHLLTLGKVQTWYNKRKETAASPASMLTTESRIFSTLCTGLHRSALLS